SDLGHGLNLLGSGEGATEQLLCRRSSEPGEPGSGSPPNSASTGTPCGPGWPRSRSCSVATSPEPRRFRPWPWPSNSPNSSRTVSAAPTSSEVFGPERLRDLEDSAEGLGLSDADAHALAEVAHGHGAFDA